MESDASILAPLHIESLAHGGAGVGRHEGKAVMVPYAAPGDTIACRVVHRKKRFVIGQIDRILERSSLRRTPACPVFGDCGGCQWQHIPYPEQAHWKETVFFDALLRHGKISIGKRCPILPAPSEWNYRTRIQVKCHWSGDRLAMGFFRRGSHFVVDAPGCPIAHPALNRSWDVLRRALTDPQLGRAIPQIDLETGEDDAIRVVVHFLGKDPAGLIRTLDPLALAEGWSWFVQSGRKTTLRKIRGQDNLTFFVDDPPLELAYGPGGFAQVNLEQNRRLVAWVLDQAGPGPGEKVLDIYCGTGNFSLPLAKRSGSLTGVEDYRPAAALAARNALRNGIRNTTFLGIKSHDALARMGTENQVFDLVVLDPPRQGAAEILQPLAALHPQRLLYVSCDPMTLARDLKCLAGNGFRVATARPIDLFPQTFHVEGVVLLERHR